MQRPEFGREYRWEEAVVMLPSGQPELFSQGCLVATGSTGLLFADIGQPPNQSHFLSPSAFRWLSTESDLQFYNSTVLSFRSRFRHAGRELYLFGKRPKAGKYRYLGLLSVHSGDCPSASGGREFPRTVIVQFHVQPSLDAGAWAEFNWSDSPILVNGLALPAAVKKAIVTDRWKFVAPDKMVRYTDQLRYLYHEGLGDCYALALATVRGQAVTSPSTLDLDRAICFGDTGPDEPLCLDYRFSVDKPQVIHLSGEGRPAWRMVAPDMETFIDVMGMTVI